MVARAVFPEYLQDDQNGHWMQIDAMDKGSSSAAASVMLFVPGGINGSNMLWQHQHEYQEAKLSKIITGAASSIPVVGTALAARQALAPMAGGAINPKVEVLYRDTNLRKFQFSFIMSPQSQSEAESLKSVVKVLRKYSSPTIKNGRSDPEQGYIGSGGGQADYLSTGGMFLSPYEFRIRFHYKDANGVWRDNLNVPRIGRSVIEYIDINYTPTGEWSTFHDGMPTSAMLTMIFREMRVIDSQNIEDGY